jgi:poly-gamma-glutamate capsule biosynthesis protein CapA/YwtB (metallophosphatase superfamily)
MHLFSWKRVLFLLSIVLIISGLFGLPNILQPGLQLPGNIKIVSQELPTAPNEPQTFSILFGGDLMFDRSIRQSMNKNGVNFILEPLRQTLRSYDLVVANLEGPITTFPSRSVNSALGSTNNFIFTFDQEIVSMLKDHNFSLLSLGNNHIRNFGVEGVTQTKTFLRDGGIGFFGDTGEESTSEERVVFIEKEGKKLAFVGVNQFVSNGFENGEKDVIFARSRADIVIVMPHWGNEYWPESGSVIEEYAHRFIDLGADVIIGSHPHVIQQVEEYRGKKIYYSVGNFVFDQYFEEAVKKGMLVGVEVHPDGALDFKEMFIQLKPNGQTVLLAE